MYRFTHGDHFPNENSKMDLNRIVWSHFFMASPADGWPVWIPLIVGLAPGLVYWLAITASKKRR
jgi:hypothetical protein